MDNITLTIEQSNIIRLITQIISGFSLGGSILILCTFWFFKDNRTFNLELVQYYALSNLFYSACAYLPYNPENRKPDIYCKIQSVAITLFQNSSLVWSSIIGFCAFISVLKKNHFDDKKIRYRILFIFAAYILTAGMASM
jgi:hypothetical protein